MGILLAILTAISLSLVPPCAMANDRGAVPAIHGHESAASWNNKGADLFSAGKYEPAIRDFDQAIKLNPKYAAAYSNRGAAYDGLNHPEKSVKDYSQALVLNPGMMRVYSFRALAYYDLGRFKDAVNDWNVVLKHTPRDAFGYSKRALCYQSMGNSQAALKDYEKALSINPHLTAALKARDLLRRAVTLTASSAGAPDAGHKQSNAPTGGKSDNAAAQKEKSASAAIAAAQKDDKAAAQREKAVAAAAKSHVGGADKLVAGAKPSVSVTKPPVQPGSQTKLVPDDLKSEFLPMSSTAAHSEPTGSRAASPVPPGNAATKVAFAGRTFKMEDSNAAQVGRQAVSTVPSTGSALSGQDSQAKSNMAVGTSTAGVAGNGMNSSTTTGAGAATVSDPALSMMPKNDSSARPLNAQPEGGLSSNSGTPYTVVPRPVAVSPAGLISNVANHMLGNFLFACGQYDAAASAFGAAAAGNPNDPFAYYRAGNALQAAGQKQRAIHSYDLALHLSPHFKQAIAKRNLALKSIARADTTAPSVPLGTNDSSVFNAPNPLGSTAPRPTVIQETAP